MAILIVVAVVAVSWATLTIYLDGVWAKRREVWLVQLSARRIADEAWEWLNSR